MSSRRRECERPDPDELQRWVILDGVAPGRVGDRLGRSRATGYTWLNRYGIIAQGPMVTQASLVSSWRAGISAEQLAAEHGLPPHAVHERLISAAVLRPRRAYHIVGSGDDPLPEPLLRVLYGRQHFTVAQIAALTGATQRQVRYRLAHYGFPPGKPGPEPKAVAMQAIGRIAALVSTGYAGSTMRRG